MARNLCSQPPNAVQIAVDAAGHIGKKYATFQPLWAALGWPAAQSASASALFCSTFVAVVVAQATQIALDFDPFSSRSSRGRSPDITNWMS